MKRLPFLEDPPTRNALLSYFLKQGAWTLAREYKPNTDDARAHEIEWAAGERDQHRIAFVDDRRLGVQFFAFWSDEQQREDEIEQKLLKGPFEVITHDRAMEQFRTAKSSEERLRAFGKVAVSAPAGFAARLEPFVRAVLNDPDASVRARALARLTYMAWPEWKPMIAPLLDDADAEVRENAKILLDCYVSLKI